MLIGRALAIARLRGLVPATWRGWAFVVVGAGYLLAIPCFAISSGPSAVSGNIGVGLLLAVNVALLLLDWRAFVTLGGLLSGRRLGIGLGLVLAILLCAGWIAPPFALWGVAV